MTAQKRDLMVALENLALDAGYVLYVEDQTELLEKGWAVMAAGKARVTIAGLRALHASGTSVFADGDESPPKLRLVEGGLT